VRLLPPSRPQSLALLLRARRERARAAVPVHRAVCVLRAAPLRAAHAPVLVGLRPCAAEGGKGRRWAALRVGGAIPLAGVCPMLSLVCPMLSRPASLSLCLFARCPLPAALAHALRCICSSLPLSVSMPTGCCPRCAAHCPTPAPTLSAVLRYTAPPLPPPTRRAFGATRRWRSASRASPPRRRRRRPSQPAAHWARARSCSPVGKSP
jgi:hypothetical protein